VPQVAIVDYGMGNLFSVQRACAHVGLLASITATPGELGKADGVIVPGVGGMPDAMRSLLKFGLGSAIVDYCAAGKPLLGVCLGLQLLMAEGTEFERHKGLGILPGSVLRLDRRQLGNPAPKVPHVGWNHVWRASSHGSATGPDPWAGTPLAKLPDGAFMYFVHSYYVQPDDMSICVATTDYGPARFCSVVHRGNVFGCQFHPERSGLAGLRIYKQFASLLQGSQPEQ
jgi:imidazole glycerol-phosphate synthase subunit HisH